jgi:hypothetical protein
MERESLDSKIVMDDGPNTEVLARRIGRPCSSIRTGTSTSAMRADHRGAPRRVAGAAPRQTTTLMLRKMRARARVEGLNPDLWADDDYAIVDPDINKRVGRIYPEMILGEPKWLWFLQTEPAPPTNSGKADTLEEAKAAFKRRYAEVKGRA